MSRVALLHTLGNRDLQFPRDRGLPPDFARQYLTDNTERGAEQYLVIRKTNEDPVFRAICGRLLRAWDDPQQGPIFAQAMCFPMLEAAMDYVQEAMGQVDLIQLCATLQAPPHPLDTDLLGELAMKYWQQRWQDEPDAPRLSVAYLNVASAEQGPVRMLRFFHRLLANLREEGYDRIFISHNQGLPQATRTLDMLGFFRDYTYLRLDPRRGVFTVDQSPFEEVIFEAVRDRMASLLEHRSPRPRPAGDAADSVQHQQGE